MPPLLAEACFVLVYYDGMSHGVMISDRRQKVAQPYRLCGYEPLLVFIAGAD